MKLYLILFTHYKIQAMELLKNEGIKNPSGEQIHAYIIKCCIHEILSK